MQAPDSKKLREQLNGWYVELHADNKFAGDSFVNHLRSVKELTDGAINLSVLDFGCGPRGGLKKVGGFPHVVYPFDPYVAEFSADPWKRRYDLIFSSDVLEHLLVNQLYDFCDKVVRSSPRYLFLAIATRAATKSFPNGINVHLTVEPAPWWMGFLQARLRPYELQFVREDHFRGIVEIGFRRDNV